MSTLSPKSGRPNPWLAVCTEIVRRQLPGDGLLVVADSESGEFSHVQVRVVDVGELTRWSIALSAPVVGHEHGNSRWSTVSGQVAGHDVQVATEHRSVES